MPLGNQFTAQAGNYAPIETYTNEFVWGRDYNIIRTGSVMSSVARDIGATPTTILRAGLVVGTITATNKLREYAAINTDGSQVATGILMIDVNVLDRNQTAADQNVWIMVAGPVRPVSLYGFDDTARAAMAGRFIFDDRGFASLGSLWGVPIAKTVNYTVLSTDSGSSFSTQGAAGAVTFTLPATLVRGFRARFQNEAAQNMTVAAPANKLVAFNNLTATSVAFQTAGNLIGGGFDIAVNADATKYVVFPLGTGTVTVA